MNYTLKVEYNENSDEYYVILPKNLLKELKWKNGDQIEWKVKKDGSIVLKKVNV